MALGILQLGFLVEFVSIPVVSGFTSAASLIIACSQIKGLLGIQMHGESFIEIWKELTKNIGQTRIPDLSLSLLCIAFLLIFKNLKNIRIRNNKLSKFLWYLCTGRNALVVVFSTAASYLFEIYGAGAPFILTGHIDAGLPKVQPPSFSVTIGNHTESFLDICQDFGSGIFIVPLISIIGNVAIAKAFSRGQTLDATQEMLTLGLCNLVGSFFHSMPVTGSFSRSAVNNASGVRTPFGGLYTGILVLFSLSLLTPCFYYIPKATLSSVLICAVIFMMEISILKPMWKCSKRDLIPGFVTFLACLFAGVELGILIGVIVDLAIVIYFNARPTIYIEYRNSPSSSYVLVRPSSGLLFPAVDYLKLYLTETLMEDHKTPLKNHEKLTNVVLDCGYIDRIDFTAAQGLNAAMKDFKDANHRLIMLRPSDEVLHSVQALSKDPILTAKTEQELATMLRQAVPEVKIRQTVINNMIVGSEEADNECKDATVSTKL
ncbi:sodium-independent sulfate anion transporter-like isoform X2 [Prorops nasuta]